MPKKPRVVRPRDPGIHMRKVLELGVRRVVGERPRRVALMLSGGIDSTVVGLAGHELGHKIHAYTFQLGKEQNYDSKWAERTAKIMGWDWTLVRLPTNPQAIVDDWPRMYRQLHCRKKREFECTWPWLYAYPRVEEKYVLNGLNAEAFYSLSRKAWKFGAGGKDSIREKFDEWREKGCLPLAQRGQAALSSDYNPSNMFQNYLIQRECGLVDVNPFTIMEMYDFLMSYSWQELNLPKQKQFLRWAYPEHIEKIGARNHKNFQHAGGISDHFECLLDTVLNPHGAKRTLDMFTLWWRDNREDEALEIVRSIEERAEPRSPRRARS